MLNFQRRTGFMTKTYTAELSDNRTGRFKEFGPYRKNKWSLIDLVVRTLSVLPKNSYTKENKSSFWNEYNSLKRLEKINLKNIVTPTIIDEYTIFPSENHFGVLCTENIEGLANGIEFSNKKELYDLGYAIATLDSHAIHMVDLKMENFGRTKENAIFVSDFEHSRWSEPNYTAAGFGIGTLKVWLKKEYFINLAEGYKSHSWGKVAYENEEFITARDISTKRFSSLVRPLIGTYRRIASAMNNH